VAKDKEMAIFKVYNDGKEETVIQKSSRFTFNNNGKIAFKSVTRVLYYHKHPISPALVDLNNKRYIVPLWTEVHPSTTLDDIIHLQPEVKSTTTKTKSFKSSSNPKVKYKTSTTILPTGKVTYNCNCPGRWRAKDGECKHIKSVKL
tara:strand:- start:849 stop:1286 length:438 start_codon:yes stop_codon:yes gene_type:complete